MARPKSKKPGYCRHKSSGRAYVCLDGQYVYLGKHGTQESRDAYDREIGEWIARGRRPAVQAEVAAAAAGDDGPGPGVFTVAHLIHGFWEHAKVYYVHPDGRPTSEQDNIRQAMRPLKRLYGPTPAASFGPLALKALREAMLRPQESVDKVTGKTTTRPGWVRTHVNRSIARIKTAFKWAASNELVPVAVHQALTTVPGLKRGRTGARESKPVKPAPDAYVDAVAPWVSAQIGAIVRLQLLTGARAGELCILRTCDVDTSGPVWTSRPAGHKTAHNGHERIIYFGPQAQEVLKPLLKVDANAYIFSPADAETARLAKLHQARRTPLNYGNCPGTNRRSTPRHTPGSRYTVTSYRRAISRACERAFPPPARLARGKVPGTGQRKGPRWETDKEWRARLGADAWAELEAWRRAHHFHPHQLRHNAGTQLRKEHGIEVARVILGHRSTAVTELYAERDDESAKKVMGRAG